MHDQKNSSTPVIHRLKSTGAWNAAWDVFAELDPVWTEKFLDMGFTPVMRGYLDQKTWELIAIAVDASCTHMYGPGVRRHIRGALDRRRNGAARALMAGVTLGADAQPIGLSPASGSGRDWARKKTRFVSRDMEVFLLGGSASRRYRMTPRGGKDRVLSISARRSPMITQGASVWRS